MIEQKTKLIKDVETLVKEENISANDWSKSFIDAKRKFEFKNNYKKTIDHDFVRAWMASAIETAISATHHKLHSVDDVDVGVQVYENKREPHLYNIGDIPMYKCPKCDSGSFLDDIQNEDHFIYVEHKCRDCGCEWEDRYDLVRRRLTYAEPLSPTDKLKAIHSLINMDGEDITDGEILDCIISIIGEKDTK